MQDSPLKLSDCWAKTDPATGRPALTVRDHCLIVGAVAEAVGASPVFTWLSGCHDVGKVSPGFLAKSFIWLQDHHLTEVAKSRLWKSAETDHSKVSQFSLQHHLRNHQAMSKDDAALWAALSAMHHGSPHWRGKWNEYPPGIVPDDHWEILRQELIHELAACFNVRGRQQWPQIELSSQALLFRLAGLTSVADWIGSDERFFPPAGMDRKFDLDDVRITARDAISQIGLTQPNFTQGLEFAELFEFHPNKLQVETLATITEPGVYVIEAPMGMGKTEAALAAAYQLISNGHATGLYFALPTQATSNRIHQRVSEFLNRCGGNIPRLIHSGSWLIDDKMTFPHQEGFGSDFRSARDWFASSKRALLAPFGVGTIDQALMAVIAVRHFFIRYFALAGKVVVIDEVHSYDVYTGTLVTALVDALRQLGCTVIILSATLTRERRLQLLASSTHDQTELANSDAFPLITGNTSAGAIRSCPIDPPPAKPPIAIRFRSESEARIAAVNAAEAGACVLWICNTVDRAIDTREVLASGLRADRATVGLLHSRFPFFQREAHETHWLDSLGKDRTHRPKGCLLVSTQIVEQSVDIDADLIISEMAPTDMLFQRLGRMWRHWSNGEARPGFPQPEFWILEESTPWKQIESQLDSREIRRALGKKAWVYQPYVLLRSLEVWHASSQVTLPSDIRPWLEETYVSRADVERPAWQELHSIMIRQKEKHLGQATTAQNVWSLDTLKDEEGVGTRLNQSPALPLILAKKQTRETLELLDGSMVVLDSNFAYVTAKALHRNVVKAPLHWFANNGGRLRSVSSATGFILRLHVKGDFEIGFVRDGVVDIDGLPEGSQLRYDSYRGLRREKHRTHNSSFESDEFDPCDW